MYVCVDVYGSIVFHGLDYYFDFTVQNIVVMVHSVDDNVEPPVDEATTQVMAALGVQLWPSLCTVPPNLVPVVTLDHRAELCTLGKCFHQRVSAHDSCLSNFWHLF